MYFTMTTSVYQSRQVVFATFKFSLNYLNIVQNMFASNWKSAKEKFLQMEHEEKRPHYHCVKNGKSYKTVADIPTWTEYVKMSKDQLPQKIDVLDNFKIDSSKNEDLAKKISIFMGDIVALEIDAIVNAANSKLLGGGGVDGAIHNAAGVNLLAECRTLNGCNTGEAKVTGAYELPSKYVIHTVGPQGEKPDLLSAAYKNSLDILLKLNLRTIAFPCISTGVYGYPKPQAAHVACKQIRSILEQNGANIDRVIFCLFNDEDQVIYEGVLQSYFPVSN